ncbi:MAG: preprotein translocase subunit SecG [Candidatus Pseudobacter hemicellulosilyticus]|uniref:Protein-export membrane protein SecG n=1 Tax=Candidatus Pseudobacter hemicellulosilyticus TaxID=3121375 RepID=A0AAJ5WMX4_9BACT|nr:MAG: preprotein translocase subunit SecG [Pseudobacter sp.]
MTILFLILIIIASIAIGLFILVQNPKGGGLAGNIAGFNSQFMGVKQTTDVLEKGTWVLAVVIGLLCLFSAVFIPSGTSSNFNTDTKAPSSQQATPPPAANPGTAPALPTQP